MEEADVILWLTEQKCRIMLNKIQTKENLTNVALVFIALFFSIIIAEITIRFFQTDYKILSLNKVWVGFNYLEKDFHQSSSDVELLYELKPNLKVLAGPSHANEKYKDFEVVINSHGLRGKEFLETKPKNTFRVIVVGASNTFGMVAEKDTYPQQLEDLLNKSKSSVRYEVINAGVSGYRLSQISYNAIQLIEKYKPDLVVIQSSNKGRRAFWQKELNFEYYLSKNADLLTENLPNIVFDSILSDKVHQRFLQNSAFYRAVAAFLNNRTYHKLCAGQSFEDCINKTSIYKRYSAYGDEISEKWFKILIEKYTNMRFIKYDGYLQTCEESKFKENPLVLKVTGCFGSSNVLYTHIHPPSWIYTKYAEQLADVMSRHKLLE